MEEPAIRDLVSNSFRAFFARNVMQYDYREHPVYLTGSIAWYYQDILKDVAREFELRLGNDRSKSGSRSDSLSLCFINNKLSNSVFIMKNLYSYCVCFWGCWVIVRWCWQQPAQKLVNGGFA